MEGIVQIPVEQFERLRDLQNKVDNGPVVRVQYQNMRTYGSDIFAYKTEVEALQEVTDENADLVKQLTAVSKYNVELQQKRADVEEVRDQKERQLQEFENMTWKQRIRNVFKPFRRSKHLTSI